MIENQLREVIDHMINDNALHCRWLNTLSMMENVGATKIVSGYHPLTVTEQKLKHAAEETRHAWYLKRQIRKVDEYACPNYQDDYLLLPRQSFHYLHALDWKVSRLLKQELNLSGVALKDHAYILVTYAIEVAADSVYGAYQEQLKQHQSPVSVRGILAEEVAHLEEMRILMCELFSDEWVSWAEKACAMQQQLFNNWVSVLHRQYCH